MKDNRLFIRVQAGHFKFLESGNRERRDLAPGGHGGGRRLLGLAESAINRHVRKLKRKQLERQANEFRVVPLVQSRGFDLKHTGGTGGNSWLRVQPKIARKS